MPTKPITVKTFTGHAYDAHDAAAKADQKANEWLAANTDQPIDLHLIHVSSAACSDGTMRTFIHAITVVYRPV